MSRTALVTGGCGFIGSHLVDALLARGDTVRVVDDLSTGHRENLPAEHPALSVTTGDLCDPAVLEPLLDGVDVVYHQGARPSVAVSVEEPADTFRVNVGGTHALLLTARKCGVRRVVMASSSSIYGNVPTLPKHEGLAPQPESPYAAQKLAAEQLGLAFSRSMGLEFVALRYFNVYGPRQRPDSAYAAVIPAFAAALVAGQRPRIHGDGAQTRDFTFIKDVVRANLAAGDARRAPGHTFNIAGGRRISVLELFAQVRAAVGGDALAIEPEHTDPRPGDVRDSLASIERATEILGFLPEVPLDDGIRRTVESFRAE